MKLKTILLFCSLISLGTGMAQVAVKPDTACIIKQVLSMAEVKGILRQSALSPQVYRLAITSLYKHLASKESEAYHLMGMAHYNGAGVNKDYELARKAFEIGERRGYLKSAYNLAMMYRLGIGVEQDFSKAYSYLIRAAEGGDPQSVYARGYFYYKGLGCEQSYDSAMVCFKAAANQNHGYAMYMMGLMYRNGYGTARNNGEAYYWLHKASENKVSVATEELGNVTPENPLAVSAMRSAAINPTTVKTPAKYSKIKHQLTEPANLQGVYTGTLATYDWSCKHVISEVPLELRLTCSGNEFTAHWQEDTLTTVEAKGIITDSALIFTQASYSKHDHYNQTDPIRWDFKLATLSIAGSGSMLNLAGNLQLYSPDTREPAKPMTMNLQSALQKNSTEQLYSSQTDGPLAAPMIYPNPVGSHLNLSFYLTHASDCSVLIFSAQGTKVYAEQTGKLPAGKHRYQVELDLLPGYYTVRLSYGGKVYSTPFVKK